MLKISSLYLCSILLGCFAMSGTATACGDLKCPFTGQPPNYECPPAFKDTELESSGIVTLELTGMTAGGQAGQTSCQAAVVAPFGLLTPIDIRMLDARTGLRIPGFGSFRSDPNVTAAHYPGLELVVKRFLGVTPANTVLLPSGFFTRLVDDVKAGIPLTVAIDFKVTTGTSVSSAAIAQLMTGNVRVSLGESTPDGNPTGHTTWFVVTELERGHATTGGTN